MAGYNNSLVQFIHSLSMAKHFSDDLVRQYGGTKMGRLFSIYSKKLDWVANDLVTCPSLPHEITDRIKDEFKSDVFEIQDINEKAHILSPSQRETISLIIDSMLAGEEINIIDTNEINPK